MDSTSLIITLLAAGLPFFIFCAYRSFQHANRQPFRFLDLPQELRDMVYENLMEDPCYPPPPPPCDAHGKTGWRRRGGTAAAPRYRGQHCVFLVSKQLYREYMDMLCKRTTFHLTVSPQACSLPDGKIWNIGKDTLQNMRTCSLNLITTSAMLGASDPRNMASADWPLARQIREQLKDVANIASLTLDTKALGDPLWNPLWIWFHSSQSFKAMGTPLSDTTPVGPKLTRITFSLDTWSPGENYLQRDEQNGGRWTWHCIKGHEVGLDKPVMTVREFCGKLYEGCRVCGTGGVEVEEEGEEGEEGVS